MWRQLKAFVVLKESYLSEKDKSNIKKKRWTPNHIFFRGHCEVPNKSFSVAASSPSLYPNDLIFPISWQLRAQPCEMPLSSQACERTKSCWCLCSVSDEREPFSPVSTISSDTDACLTTQNKEPTVQVTSAHLCLCVILCTSSKSRFAELFLIYVF